MRQHERRWEGDTVGHGIAAGSVIAPDVERFLSTLSEPLWVAEAPEVHLLPHLERACAAPESPWQLVDATLDDDAVYQVTLRWLQPGGHLRRLRGDVFALIGSIAESATYVQQRVTTDDVVIYDVCTGMLAGDSPFRPHGHLMRLTVQRR